MGKAVFGKMTVYAGNGVDSVFSGISRFPEIRFWDCEERFLGGNIYVFGRIFVNIFGKNGAVPKKDGVE